MFMRVFNLCITILNYMDWLLKPQPDMGVDSNQTTAVIDPSETGVIMNWNSNNKKVSSVQ